MKDFNYCAPTRVIFGKNTELEVGKALKNAGATRVLMQYGGGSIKKSGLYDRVVKAIRDEGIELFELGGVQPNPHLSLVRKAIEIVREQKIDYLLAVGGGSAIDSTKATAVGAVYDGDVWDFYCGKAVPKKAMPVGVVLTIPAAGSEGSNSSVITNEDGWLKRDCSSDLSRPVFSVMNPALTVTLPDYQTASGCVDIMMHTMERYFNSEPENLDLTDGISEALMRTVMENARILRDRPDDLKARAEVMWAGSLSHNGLTGCGTDGGDWATHLLEHEMGGMFDVAHGAGLAAIWGSWARYVWQARPDRFVKFARNVMGVTGEGSDAEIVERGIQAVEQFYRDIHMPTNMRELGIEPTDAQIAEMAKKSVAEGTVKVLNYEDKVAIYKMAR